MNEIAETQDTALSPKDLIKQNILSQMLSGVKTKKQIAKNLEISRPTLNKYMREMDKNEIIHAELEGLKDQMLPAFMEMFNNPDDTTWRKMSADNLMKWMLKQQDKITPNRNETININVDLDKLQLREQVWSEAVSRMPPSWRTQFFKNIEALKQEWSPT